MTAEEYVVKQCLEKDEKIKLLELNNKALKALAEVGAEAADKRAEFIEKLKNQLTVTIRDNYILITSKCNSIRREDDPEFFQMMKDLFEKEGDHEPEPSEPVK